MGCRCDRHFCDSRGFFTLSDTINRVVEREGEERDKDVAKLRENVIQSVADFRFSAKEALQDIKNAREEVAQEKTKAIIAIRPSSLSAAASYQPSDTSSGVAAGSVTIPVVIHVIYSTDVQNISDAQIR